MRDSHGNRIFPLLSYDRRQYGRACPESIPWNAAEASREQAQKNHYQTLERLDERGGLSVMEIWWAAHGMPLPGFGMKISEEDKRRALSYVRRLAGMDPMGDGLEVPNA